MLKSSKKPVRYRQVNLVGGGDRVETSVLVADCDTTEVSIPKSLEDATHIKQRVLKRW